MADVAIECLAADIKFTINPADCDDQQVRSHSKSELEVQIQDGSLVFLDVTDDTIIIEGPFQPNEITNLDFATIEDYWDFFNACILSTTATVPVNAIKEDYFHVSADTAVGDHNVDILAGSGTNEYTFNAPTDFKTLISAVLVCFSDSTESGTLDFTTSFGSVGESATNTTDSDTTASTAFTEKEALDVFVVDSTLATCNPVPVTLK